MSEAHSHFLIIRFSSMGDIALTNPVLDRLLADYGPASVDYITKKFFVPVIRYHPVIRNVFIPENEKSLIHLRHKIRKNRYTRILDLHKNLRSLFLTLGLKGVHRIKKDILKRYLLTRFKIHRPPYLHVTQKYLNTFSRQESVHAGSSLYLPPENVLSEKNRKYYMLLKQEGKNLILAPGASKPSKMLPFETWEKVLIVLRDRFKHIFIIGNGYDEHQWAKKLTLNTIYESVTDLTRQLNIEELMLFVARSSLFAGNDSGPAHLAALSGIPTLVVFGQTVPEYGFTPLNNTHLVEPPVHLVCRPYGHLGHKRCPEGHHNCMKSIDPETIINRIIELSNNKNYGNR
jgi:ADP-heptose:LPS heptosyltransferase